MEDVCYIERLDQAAHLMKPARLEVLRQTARPVTCTEVGERVGQSAQAVYYHMKALERAGLVKRVAERRVRAISEGIYQASARSYWISPKLVGHLGGDREQRDARSLGFLISLAEEIQDDVGRLATRSGPVASLGLAAEIELPDAADRSRFLEEVHEIFEALSRKYGATGQERGATYKLALACYPQEVQ